jgi:glycosyltransferase involved in cell wall biosynthesis
LLGGTPIWWLEPVIFKFNSKKVVVIPYGSDAYVYRRIRSVNLIHGLMISYPNAARLQNPIAKRVAKWTEYADAVLPSGMGNDGIGRWDTLLPTTLYLDLKVWKKTERNSDADGYNCEVVIAHAPNHRGAKGSEFVIDAIDKLQRSGLKCRLVLLEGMQNSQVKDILQRDVDILVEQLLHGTGLNGLEGMACGLPVVSNFEEDSYWDIYRTFSYFDECPGVSASSKSIESVLRVLITTPRLRKLLGEASRSYVEKYHGIDSAKYLFENVLDFIYGRSKSIINLYHPLIGEYPKRKPKIEHPLIKNKLPENFKN